MSGTVQAHTTPALPGRYTGPVDYYPGDFVLLPCGKYATRLGKIERFSIPGKLFVVLWDMRKKRWSQGHCESRWHIIGFAPKEYVHALGADAATL